MSVPYPLAASSRSQARPGGASAVVRPGDRYTAERGTAPMTGVQAMARLAVDVRRWDRAEPQLSPEGLDRCVAVASAPDEVRGYENIKLASVARYRARLGELTAPAERA